MHRHADAQYHRNAGKAHDFQERAAHAVEQVRAETLKLGARHADVQVDLVEQLLDLRGTAHPARRAPTGRVSNACTGGARRARAHTTPRDVPGRRCPGWPTGSA